MATWVLFLFFIMYCMSMGDVMGGGAPSPSSSTDCSSAILSLADCLPFVQEGSKVTKPEKSCCSGLKKVVKEDVACLCEAFKQSANFGVSLNITKALSLPAACKVSTPPISKCNIALPGVPTAAPAPVPGAPTTSSSSAVPAPAPGHSISGAASTGTSVALLFSVALAVSAYYI